MPLSSQIPNQSFLYAKNIWLGCLLFTVDCIGLRYNFSCVCEGESREGQVMSEGLHWTWAVQFLGLGSQTDEKEKNNGELSFCCRCEEAAFSSCAFSSMMEYISCTMRQKKPLLSSVASCKIHGYKYKKVTTVKISYLNGPIR